MNTILLLVLIAKLSGAMVTNNSGSKSETIPTNLFKPLSAKSNEIAPTSSPSQPTTSYNNALGEAFGSSSFTKGGNEGDSGISNAGGIGLKSFFDFPQFQGISPPVLRPSFHEVSSPFPASVSDSAQEAYQAHLRNRNAFLQNDLFGGGSSFPLLNNFESGDVGKSHYQVSSSRTFYDSNSMNAPITQNYHYDSRNGGSINF